MKGLSRWIRTGIVVLVSVGAIVVLLVWLAGGFHEKIRPGPTQVGLRPLGNAATLAVEQVSVLLEEEAIGTVRAEHETAVGARIMARVLAIHARAGQRVEKDQVLIELDHADLEARLAQARAAVDAAQAARDQAQTNYDRIAELRASQTATEHEYTTATSDLAGAGARLEQAGAALREAENALSYATIRSPLAGVVIDKTVDVGDMVTPGQTVLRLYDQLQLIATVRESLAANLQVGQQLPVTLEALDFRCHGTVSEIVPEADALSRAFQVKVTGPCPEGVIPGMFGRLFIPLGQRQELRIPRTAVRRVGQIPCVQRVLAGGQVERAFIQIAREYDDHVAVASGLSAGDTIVADPDQP